MHTRLEGRRDLKSDFLGILSCKKVNLIGIGARPPQNIQKIPWMLKCSSCSLVQGIKFVTTEKGSPGHLAVLGKAGSPSCEKAVKLWGGCPAGQEAQVPCFRTGWALSAPWAGSSELCRTQICSLSLRALL